MSEPPEHDHWADLASELGTPPPPPREPEQGSTPPADAAAKAPPVPKAPPRRREAAPPATRSAAGWAELASELGIEVPPEALAPPPPRPALREPEPALRLGPPEGTRPDVFETPQAPGDWAEEVEEAAPPLETWQPARPREATGEADDRRSGRRRRKRRRPRPGDEPREAVEPIESLDAGEDDTELEGDLPTEFGAEEEADVAVSPGAASDEPASERPRRRRRRRRHTPSDREATPVAAKPERVSTGTASTPGDAELDEEGPLDADEVGESEDSDEHGTKIIHRGVPTWKETVEVLIAANLESRARRPERGPPNRSRNGNRNRGGRE